MGSVLSRLGVHASEEEVDIVARSIKDWPAFPDTVEALRALKKRYKLAVISNVDDDIFPVTARHLQTDFDWVVTAEEARCYKPDPRIFVLASAKMGIPKERHLHAAQSLFHDVAPAKALGLTTVWVNRRKGRAGTGATPPSHATPDAEVPDLQTLAALTSRT
jgi:2-haloacid dehalogenase